MLRVPTSSWPASGFFDGWCGDQSQWVGWLDQVKVRHDRSRFRLVKADPFMILSAVQSTRWLIDSARIRGARLSLHRWCCSIRALYVTKPAGQAQSEQGTTMLVPYSTTDFPSAWRSAKGIVGVSRESRHTYMIDQSIVCNGRWDERKTSTSTIHPPIKGLREAECSLVDSHCPVAPPRGPSAPSP